MRSAVIIGLLVVFGMSKRVAAQDSIEFVISTEVFYDTLDEWLDFYIINSETSEIVYDTSVTVFYDGGYTDTLYLDSACYKCYIIDMGANIYNPHYVCGKDTISIGSLEGEDAEEFCLPCIPFVDPPTDGLEENQMKVIRVYPNPVDEHIWLKLTDGAQISEFDIWSVDGQLIQKPVQLKESMIDVSEIPSGEYLIRFYLPDLSIVHKRISIF